MMPTSKIFVVAVIAELGEQIRVHTDIKPEQTYL